MHRKAEKVQDIIDFFLNNLDVQDQCVNRLLLWITCVNRSDRRRVDFRFP